MHLVATAIAISLIRILRLGVEGIVIAFRKKMKIKKKRKQHNVPLPLL